MGEPCNLVFKGQFQLQTAGGLVETHFILKAIMSYICPETNPFPLPTDQTHDPKRMALKYAVTILSYYNQLITQQHQASGEQTSSYPEEPLSEKSLSSVRLDLHTWDIQSLLLSSSSRA